MNTRWILTALLSFLLAVLMVAWVTIAQAADAYTNGKGDVLVLSDAPCDSMKGALSIVPVDQRHPDLRAAKYFWKGKYYDACWIRLPDGRTAVVDETGDVGVREDSEFDRPAELGV